MPTADSPATAACAPLARAEIRRIVYGLMMSMLLAALDQTIVATALPTIGRDLNDVIHLPWVVTAYLLSATSAVPIYGKLSDIHGRRVTMLAGLWIFLAGSVVCAMAPNMTVLILGRLIQGAGGGGLLALSQTIIGDIMSPRERAGWQVYFATAFTVASLSGPVLGGFFAQHLSWTMIFWINVPLGAAALVMTSGPLKRLPRHERPHKLDVWGAVLLVTATSTLLLAVSWAGVRFGWAGLTTLGLLGLSMAMFAAFYWRLRHEAEPLIPLEVLCNKVVLTATAAATLSVGLFLGLAIYSPILFESVRGLSASESGLAMLPLTVGTVCGTMMAGRAMARLDHYKQLPIMVLPCAIASATVLMIWGDVLPVWAVSMLLAVVSVGLGTLLPISTISIQNAVALHQLGTATATANLCRQLGGAVAVAVFGAIVLGGHADAVAVRIGVRSAAELLPLVHGFRIVFGLVITGCLAAIVTMIVMEERPLSGPSRGGAESLIAGE